MKKKKKKWFSLLTKPVVISCMSGNDKILPASFELDSKQFGKSFMYIRNNKSTKTDPSETPEFAVVSGDNLSFKATLR